MKKKNVIIISVIAILVIALTGVNIAYNHKQLQTRKEVLESEKISPKLDNTLVAYFSDLYYGSDCDEQRVKKLTDIIVSYNPDIVIFGGDLLNDDSLSQEEQNYLIEQFSAIKPLYGKFAVLGDNDRLNSVRLDLVTYILEQSGFEILNDTNRTIAKDNSSRINIIGISNMINGEYNIETSFSGINGSDFTIVTTHCPDSFSDLENYSFDLMLAGHSLGGEIRIPLISWFMADEGYKNFYHGKISDNGKLMDITNGVSTPGSTLRFQADPEVVFYSLRSR